ncbi:tRNA (adenosine(37)-N6)-threonylcarbamoyltransferase complex dimerization subunit type 1 TsaB [Kaistia algarum]|uniref:tRNA (adenosine(37)-N6)-threonylcarbamoyltransferase complex dimerization subunit type 1 TsaB n=1 Tax=Kaistia algarum TaxID=2083279 RepID=UPI000CE76D0F|nr:tRNA (adenosine(37)-N6)-threonylcarbamoyltransferase complex dimerization subunit type 1 TsaB [Kaistia algarum]MCX5513800.1 tRNA (adenosine(37)-N6)-threonylcarbamoyltransferase complex dimerization subunit type 1 TsaB [Kaistia algarum]PPE79334.1 tRNA (adenosine(37)-N6)-threonylcarbamoyltransferase complex dimerization subunit type 1 TsaB [Kaistia algarum]
MIVLAIDTALEDCSVAIGQGSDIRLSERTIGRGHAEILMPATAALLAEAGLSARDLDRIAVSTGPGSFTGLRVGIAAARGLGLALDIPVIGIPTLKAHAVLASKMRDSVSAPNRPILALLPARADELYGQVFSGEGDPLGPLTVANAGRFGELAPEGSYDVAGAGAALLGAAFAPIHLRSAPSIATLLDLGAALSPDAFPPAPVYGKPPDAIPHSGGIARR